MSFFPTRFSVSVSVPFHCLPSPLSLCPPHVSESAQRVTLETPGPPTAAGTKPGLRAAPASTDYLSDYTFQKAPG